MKKKSIAALACAVALSLTASADSSYTYTAGDTSLGDGAVTITYEGETTDIATFIANLSNGETITLTGDAPTFADGATITLSSSGTVSFAEQVTTKGSLTLVRSDGAYLVWTGSALTESNKKTGNFNELPFSDGSLTAADLEPSSVVYVATSGECHGRFDRYVAGPGSGIFTINRVTADHSYTIRPQVGTGGLRCITASRSQRFGYYPTTSLWANNKVKGLDKGHWCTATISDGGARLGTVSTLGFTKFFAAKKGMAEQATVRFDGGAALGGATSVAAGMEVVLAVPEGDNIISEAFTGDGDVRIVPMAPTTAYACTTYLEPFITKSTWQVIATNRSLSALTRLSGRMLGANHNYAEYSDVGGTPIDAYRLTYDATTDTATCQFATDINNENIKYVYVRFQQNGANVEIQAIGAGAPKIADGYAVDSDLTGLSHSTSVATSASGSGYGIHMITATFAGESNMGCVTLEGSMNTMVGNQLTFDGGERPLYVTVISKTAFPTYGNVNVLTNADVMLSVDDLTVATGISGGTSTLKVKRGGILRRKGNGQIASSQQVEVDGGKLDHIGGGGVYLNYLLMKDGARMTSGSTAPRSVFNNSSAYYNVLGTEPSSIEGSGVRPYGNTSASSVGRVFQINVNDVTGDDRIDCTLSSIQASASNDYPYYHFEKHGDGTLKLEGGGKPVRCQTRLYGGTFILGASSSMTNEVVLAGGSLAVDAGKSNALGALTVSNACTIAVGTGGSLSFASYTAGEELAAKSILIDAPLTGDVLKIGSTLTREEYSYFRWKDPVDETKLWKVKQDANGYLHPIITALTISIY